ncbi:MAG: cysteine hydrolase, partial [Actinobacteria bacterium]|nr:cysteine hydrolase [Actinomycetota bacterium]
MITKFTSDTALLLIDCQVGVDVLSHWGGPTGRRNNPDAESHM